MQEQKLQIIIISPQYDYLFDNAFLKFQKLGFIYLSFGAMDINGNTTSYFSHKKWAEFYEKNSLMLYDPCIQHLVKTDRFMALWSGLSRGHKRIDVMSEREKIVKMGDGVSLYYRYASGIKIIIGLGTQTREQLDLFLLNPKKFELDDAVSCLKKAYEKFILLAK